VLLGTRSFWEGVDVVGEALSLLIIAKIPFEVPTDPCSSRGAKASMIRSSSTRSPQAILRLKQGFGRLIRSKSDRGVVVALDRRLITKNYGPTFLRSLPGATFRKGPSRLLPREVERWLDNEAQPGTLSGEPLTVGQQRA
jgi:DNA polymerase-3 subunit epsilon/ATP-dependent DNA helicase DinG